MRPALADVVAVLTGDRALTEFWRVALGVEALDG